MAPIAEDRTTRNWLLGRAALIGVAVSLLLGAVFVALIGPAATSAVPTLQTVPPQTLPTNPPANPPTAADPAGGAAAQPTTTTAAAVPPILPPGERPPGWPESVPVPDDIAVLEATEIAPGEWRWILATSWNPPLAGGEFTDDLSGAGWDVAYVSTSGTITTVAHNGPESLSLVVRGGDSQLPAGWTIMEVIYQAVPPQIEDEPADPNADEREAQKQA